MEVERSEVGEVRQAQGAGQLPRGSLSRIMHLSISVRKSTPPLNRQLIVYFHSLKHQVDGFVGE